MENKRIGILILTGSLVVMFALTITSIPLLVFAQLHHHVARTPPSATTTNTTQLISKSVLQQHPNMTLQGFPGLNANGSIGSIIYLAKGLKYVSDGKWNLVDDGRHADFIVKMTWYPNTPTNSSVASVHTHSIQNFQLQGQNIKVQPNNIIIKGIGNVLTNGKVKWHNIPISIKIVGNLFDISFTGNDPNSKTARAHFGGQDTLGVVKAITECSNQPLPNMQILPDCGTLPSTTTTASINNGIPPFVSITK